ncbi:MAG: AAA family ATPase [Opitutaceae bacterium]|jgi:adenylate kinase family enzyme|nr:AAA family ATPase [Opitutaceae bacterium]
MNSHDGSLVSNKRGEGLSGTCGWVILGNSGSGKSTLARRLMTEHGASVLDLDTVAWRADLDEPVRRPVGEVAQELDAFIEAHPGGWVLEGCYEDLIAHALHRAPELIWLDVPAQVCAQRIRSRAFEPHKYASPEAQRAAADALAAWINAYDVREGPMSHAAHALVYESYAGPKRRTTDAA